MALKKTARKDASGAAPEPRAFRRVWWMPVLRGVLLVVLGLVLLLDPLQTLDAVPWIVGGFLLADAVVLGLQGSVQRKQIGAVWWLVQAAVDVVFAGTVVLWPSITPTALYYVLVCWVLVLGITSIVCAAFLGRNRDLGAAWMLVLGVVSTLFGLALLAHRLGDQDLVFVCVVFSLYAVVTGAILVVSGFAVRAIAGEIGDLRARAEAAGVVVEGGSVLGGASRRPAPAAAPGGSTPEPSPAPTSEPTSVPTPEPTSEPTTDAPTLPGGPEPVAEPVGGESPDDAQPFVLRPRTDAPDTPDAPR